MYKHKLHSISDKRNVTEEVKIYICETTLVSILHKVTSQGGLHKASKHCLGLAIMTLYIALALSGT